MDGQFGMFTFDRRYVKSEHFEQASVGPSVPMNKGGGSLHLPFASIQLYWLDGLRQVDWDEYIRFIANKKSITVLNRAGMSYRG